MADDGAGRRRDRKKHEGGGGKGSGNVAGPTMAYTNDASETVNYVALPPALVTGKRKAHPIGSKASRWSRIEHVSHHSTKEEKDDLLEYRLPRIFKSIPLGLRQKGEAPSKTSDKRSAERRPGSCSH